MTTLHMWCTASFKLYGSPLSSSRGGVSETGSHPFQEAPQMPPPMGRCLKAEAIKCPKLPRPYTSQSPRPLFIGLLTGFAAGRRQGLILLHHHSKLWSPPPPRAPAKKVAMFQLRKLPISLYISVKGE